MLGEGCCWASEGHPQHTLSAAVSWQGRREDVPWAASCCLGPAAPISTTTRGPLKETIGCPSSSVLRTVKGLSAQGL